MRQLEEALLAGRIDIAVHSAKDMPSDLLPGTTIAATLPRGDVRDALVGATLAGLAPGARVGTGSRRRVAQLLAARPDVAPLDIRGNVDTRLRKLADGQYDALILAAAGLERLGRTEAAAELLPIDIMLPAPGQGVIALQVREDDAYARDTWWPRSITRRRASRCAPSGRCCARWGRAAPCRSAVWRTCGPSEVSLLARAIDITGRRVMAVQESGPAADPEAVGRRAGERLLARGAREFLPEPVS